MVLVYLRGILQIEKQTEEMVFDHLHATAFQYSPLGRTILGSADNIRSITREDLKNYIATHYTGPRMVRRQYLSPPHLKTACPTRCRLAALQELIFSCSLPALGSY